MGKLEREHVESALDEIGDPSGIPRQHRATKYCLVARDKHWSPKYVVGRAWKHATGQEKHYTRFSGGKGGANLQLERLGYTVTPCPAARSH